ncbi:dentin sialophosphoprotein [Bombyx mori]|uniref:PDZ domain-containing protein n=1 Tax=Bombyx mori TaxID=7091 RepID=A0A8R2AJK8_BOMMO|nr:dentin sialophosphoprotein [Bombyx mori]
MAAEIAVEDFVTIVPVGEGRPSPKDPSFVTVLTVGATTGASEVIVRRPRGERLGLGLKFEGGSAAAEKVRRLLVQSCAEDSPAANAQAPWGKLIPGDEILAIDGVPVSELTRIDCVRRLKDSDETLTLLVRHFEMNDKEENSVTTKSKTTSKQSTDIIRPTTLPPPVPPRKLGKKNSFKDKLITFGEQNCSGNVNPPNFNTNDKDIMNGKHNGISTITKLSRKSSFDSHIHRQNKESLACFKKGSPEEVRRLVRRLSDGKAVPPDAEVYLDLLSSTDWERCLVLADAESDDTGSSISTVVDRLGSMASSVENSIPSTPIMQPKTIDIQKVLNCIENIDTNILKDITSKQFMEKQYEKREESNNVDKVTHGNNTNVSTSMSSEENKQTATKRFFGSDKNNNSTNLATKHENIDTNHLKNNENSDQIIEKPKPMPRNTKIERSVSERRPKRIPVPDVSPPPMPESLLTPTKKNCIETWLQRSEAEMNNTNAEKIQDTTTQEVLPRLIDFVPKSQFKESSNDSPTLTRPTTAPPPPPTETREDGSGASLDTIGELDESTDVTDSIKPIVVLETKERKSSFERTFWEDRTNKSDAEDKSLSNDETPLPSCPRQPPDGVETPSDAVEKVPDLPSRLPPRLPPGWPGARSRYSYSSRSQDARSEASVKDKIAMFSNDKSTSTERIDKCGTLPTRSSLAVRKNSTSYIGSFSDVSSLDRRLTKSQDNLDETPRAYKRQTERPEVLGGVESVNYSNYSTTNMNMKPLQANNKPLFYGSSTVLSSKPETSFVKNVYHARSVSDDNGSTVNKSNHKSNLEYLIEQRKKSMSKLKDLVIPEVRGPIVDLPEIKVQDSLTKSLHLKSEKNSNSSKLDKTNSTKIVPLNDNKWKVNLLPNNIPKYSPAFKRKSLQVYTPSSLSKESTPERNFNERVEAFNKINVKSNALNSMRSSLDSDIRIGHLSSSVISRTLSNATDYMKKDYKEVINYAREFKNVEIKMCTATDVVDSDNDSAMSSTQSSYRSSASSPMHTIENIESDGARLSPKISLYSTYSVIKSDVGTKPTQLERSCDEYVKRNICRSVSSDTNVSLSSSAGSAATSGSQASCSSLESSVADSDKRRASKTYDIDTINRRNILASAKCRSGRDAKLKSPVVEAKFSHESGDRSPSPVFKTSERLSTLTPVVSAISNKGENRRRNKIVAETDSDSDSDANLRVRKAEYKITRLKRNSSSSNKTKQNDANLESPKSEDAPKLISETIIKEIKKAGLDQYKNNNTKVAQSILDKSKTDVIKTENILDTHDENRNSKIDFKHKEIKINKDKELIVEKSSNKTNGCQDELSSQAIVRPVKDVKITTQYIRLKRGAGAGVGVILAGGIDCEAKDVTVHRVLADSVAAQAGLKRGMKIRSINGCATSGLTHAQSVSILKEQRSEVVIEIENEPQESASTVRGGSDKAESNVRHTEKEVANNNQTSDAVVSVVLEKAGGGAGLGFGLDGGRDSPRGDFPLTIKKLFAGGAAALSGRVLVGAELLSAGGQSVEGFTRTQAWAALKSLPAGPVTLVLRNPKQT